MEIPHYGFINWLGVWTLYKREIQRITRIIFQATLAPIISSLLFLSIFSVALSKTQVLLGGDTPYTHFLAAGLIAMAILDNAFTSTGPTILISKIQGNIVDLLVSPLTAGEMNAVFIAAGMTRGLLVGLSVAFCIYLLTHFPMAHPFIGIFFAMGAAMMMSALGVIAGLWATKFDQIQMITSFVVMPLTFLSGTFYRMAHLPSWAQKLCLLDPIFYFVDGIRYGLIGQADSNLWLGALITLFLNSALVYLSYFLFKSGYKLKS